MFPSARIHETIRYETNFSKFALSNTADIATPSTCGRRPVVGTPSLPTGGRTLPSLASSCSASSAACGSSAPRRSTDTSCPRKAHSSRVDSTSLDPIQHYTVVCRLVCDDTSRNHIHTHTHTHTRTSLTSTRSWSRQLIEYDREQAAKKAAEGEKSS